MNFAPYGAKMILRMAITKTLFMAVLVLLHPLIFLSFTQLVCDRLVINY